MVDWMSGISHNFLRFVHTPSVVDRLNGWQCKTDYFGCAPHKCFQLGFLLVGGATKPHSDGESQQYEYISPGFPCSRRLPHSEQVRIREE